jgi:hypothetical protein
MGNWDGFSPYLKSRAGDLNKSHLVAQLNPGDVKKHSWNLPFYH